MKPTVTRRPLTSRDTAWAKAIAGVLARWRVRPNTISVFSVFCAAMGGAALLTAGAQSPGVRAGLFVLAIIGIQARLLCNLFDGMVAVEGGMKTTAGELYNELPDRIADAIIFICAGYGVSGCPYAAILGWGGALLAVLTAYVRALGASMGAGQQFCGPMAKPHRMALMTAACVLGAVEGFITPTQRVIPIALVIVILGTIITIGRRLGRIVQAMEAK